MTLLLLTPSPYRQQLLDCRRLSEEIPDDANADLYITYHITTKDNTVLNTAGFGYGGWAAGWYGWGGIGGTTTTRATTYTDGTLIIDAYEPAEKKMDNR